MVPHCMQDEVPYLGGGCNTLCSGDGGAMGGGRGGGLAAGGAGPAVVQHKALHFTTVSE